MPSSCDLESKTGENPNRVAKSSELEGKAKDTEDRKVDIVPGEVGSAADTDATVNSAERQGTPQQQLSSPSSSPQQGPINSGNFVLKSGISSVSNSSGQFKGGTLSASNSPRQIRLVRSPALHIPPPKPPKTIVHSNSYDGSHRDNTTPIQSPSNLSISSKNTVKTGFGQHRNRMDQPPPASSDPSDQHQGSAYPFSLLEASESRGGSKSSSPKLSPSFQSSKKAAPPAPSSSTGSSQHQPFSILDHPPLPLPRKASKCPLFCCFYAEFDNVVGPKICFQSPLGFMEQETDVSLKNIHRLLATNFDRILTETDILKHSSTKESEEEAEQQDKTSPDERPVAEDKATQSPSSPQSASSNVNQFSQDIQCVKSGDSVNTFAATNTSGSKRQSNPSNGAAPGQASAKESASNPLTASNSSHNPKDVSNPLNQQPQNSRDDTTASSGSAPSTSIFDSTSDFIITGNELTGNIVNLSAFNMHLLTRPTSIHDERYERNSLLFCVGFVLRRSEDPRPFRPLLSKLALTLKRMEMETHFLSVQHSRSQLQHLLDRILVSLNCTHWETNLVVNNNILNLKLFHPPRNPATPVPDHAVPILLRRDWQVQLYDWDLAINWVVLHIDGVANARQISKKAEVDMEMVRNCLRVLKHHGIISLVDMFFYSNRYGSTRRAAAMLAGHEASLLQDAAEYVMKRPIISTIQTTAAPPYSNLMAPISPPSASPTATLQENFVKPSTGSPGSPTPSSYPPGLGENVAAAPSNLLGSSFRLGYMASYQSREPHLLGTLKREEQRALKAALAELYCAFNRNLSFGDVWIALASGKGRSQSIDKLNERDKPSSNNTGNSDNHAHGSEQRESKNGTQRPPSYTRMTSTEMSVSDESPDNLDPEDMSPREYYFERLRKKSSCATIDWGQVFETFDHRRFVSFGLVNGLLHRLHNYPCVLETTLNDHRKEDNWPPNEASFRRQDLMEDPERLARHVLAMMDGAHCDDDIVSTFEKPITELIELVEEHQGKKILPIYAVALDR